MSRLSRKIALILVSASLSACSNSNEIVQTAAKYDIQPNERMHYEICVDDMANRSAVFDGGATITDGCACATKLILSEVADAQMPIIWDYRIVEKRVDPERYEFVARKYNLSEPDADRLYRIGKSAFKLCDRKSFHTKDMVAQISALKPKTLSAQNVPATASPKLRQKNRPVSTSPPPPLKLRGRSKG